MSRNFMVSLPCAILSHVPYTRPNPSQGLVQVLETPTNRNRVPLSFLSQAGSNNFNVTLIEPGDPRRSGLRASVANILRRAVKVTGCGTAGGGIHLGAAGRPCEGSGLGRLPRRCDEDSLQILSVRSLVHVPQARPSTTGGCRMLL